MQQTYLEDQQLIGNIRKGDEKSIVQVYQLYKEEFVHWAQVNHQINEAAALEAFQDAVVCLYQNIVKGKLERSGSLLKTCLYAIGKSILRKQLQQSVVLDRDDLRILEDLKAEPLDNFASNERQRFVAKIMGTIEEPCYTIFRLFYFNNFSVEAVAQAMDNKHEDAVKTQKLRCLTTLKSRVRSRFSGEYL